MSYGSSTDSNKEAITTSLPVISPRRETLQKSNTQHTQNVVTQSSQSTAYSQDYDTIPNSDFILVYHEDYAHYILSDYCLPVSKAMDTSSPNTCRFGRSCVVHKCKIHTKGDAEPTISPTVFSRPASMCKDNFIFSMFDVRYIRCFAENCKNKSTKEAKVFHHGCYMNFLFSDDNIDLDLIAIFPSDNVVIDYVNQRVGRTVTIPLDGRIILPSCGRQCHKNILKKITSLNKSKKTDLKSDGTSKLQWDKDGSSSQRSSIQVLVDWITTEENASSYFGGKNKKGKTTGSRKETHHFEITKVIQKENGEYFINFSYFNAYIHPSPYKNI
jgi:hypothetical protein